MKKINTREWLYDPLHHHLSPSPPFSPRQVITNIEVKSYVLKWVYVFFPFADSPDRWPYSWFNFPLMLHELCIRQEGCLRESVIKACLSVAKAISLGNAIRKPIHKPATVTFQNVSMVHLQFVIEINWWCKMFLPLRRSWCMKIIWRSVAPESTIKTATCYNWHLSIRSPPSWAHKTCLWAPRRIYSSRKVARERSQVRIGYREQWWI